MSANFNDEFFSLIKARIANVCIGPSSLRRQGTSGIKGEDAIIGITRKFLKERVDLDVFFNCLKDKFEYQKALDNWTLELEEQYTKAAPNNWGAARKSLNLFFRDIVYNKFLSEKYNLPNDSVYYNQAIKFLEVPLDGNVAKEILKRNPNLPQWRGVSKLKKIASDQYQAEATVIAKNELETVSVHLDLLFWK